MKTEIKYRNMWLQVLLMIMTCGFYSIYWFYQTAEELKQINQDQSASPILWTIFLFIPILNFYGFYKYAEQYEKASSDHLNHWILFLLHLVIAPAVWIIVQLELNKRANVNLLG